VIHATWVIPLIPLGTFFVIAMFGKRLPGRGAYLGIAAMFVCFVMALGVLVHFIGGGEPVETTWTWFTSGPVHFELGQLVDGLTAAMLIVVTFISLCVQVYSLGYMHGDRRYTWFYAVLSLFTGAMLTVVVANNLFELLVGWEIMGISSYLLIGHWWEEKENSNAAIKAFITTRVGDVPFMFGIFVLTFAAGTTNIPLISRAASDGRLAPWLLTVAALLLFGGTIGKSAQFPLHVWLPDAMAGPTPVSALIHAATMVAAGVYLVARMFAVFVNASHALIVVEVIAAITMLIAALLAMIQNDIKRVLAYSTVSQLAYMLAGLSIGKAGYTAGLFHLFTHAFFKALLFLGAGSVIHAVHTNNMSEMGGLRKHMPATFVTFLVGSAALAGIPPFAGFWSKDEIISTAFAQHHYALWAVALVTAVLTAFYVTRMVLLTFFGEYRGDAHPHESPITMTAPLYILAGLACVVGFLNATALHVGLFTDWVHFGLVEHEPFNYGFATVSFIGAAIGLILGYRLYSRWRERDPLRGLGPMYGLLEHKYYLDDIYLKGIVRPIQYPLARAVYWTNQNVLDAVVNGVAWATKKLGRFTYDVVDQQVIDATVNGVGESTRAFGGFLRLIQSGKVQLYAGLLFVGVAALTVIFIAVH
jgi:NADH-quinone oxidoreductase subunit L